MFLEKYFLFSIKKLIFDVSVICHFPFRAYYQPRIPFQVASLHIIYQNSNSFFRPHQIFRFLYAGAFLLWAIAFCHLRRFKTILIIYYCWIYSAYTNSVFLTTLSLNYYDYYCCCIRCVTLLWCQESKKKSNSSARPHPLKFFASVSITSACGKILGCPGVGLCVMCEIWSFSWCTFILSIDGRIQNVKFCDLNKRKRVETLCANEVGKVKIGVLDLSWFCLFGKHDRCHRMNNCVFSVHYWFIDFFVLVVLFMLCKNIFSSTWFL